MSFLNNRKNKAAVHVGVCICALFGISSLFPSLALAANDAQLGMRVLINKRELGHNEHLGDVYGNPVISIVPELSGPDQTMIVIGENLNGLINLQGGMLKNEEVSQPPSMRPEATSTANLLKPRFIERVLAPGQEQRKSLRFITPNGWDQNHAYQIVAHNQDQSGVDPVFWLNIPIVDWVKTSTKDAISMYQANDTSTGFGPTVPEIVWSGSTLEIHGKNLSPVSGQAKAWLVPCNAQQSAIDQSCFNSGNAISLEFAATDSAYLTTFRIPSSVPPGVYSLWYHRGIGGVSGFNFDTALAVQVRAPENSWSWPCTQELALAGTDPHCLDPKNYGAVGDGTTWDTAAFLQTLNAAYANGGATILISPGTYRIGNTLLVPPKTRIVGSGSTGSGISKAYATTLLFETDRTYVRNLFLASTTSPYWDGRKYYISRVPTAATDSRMPNEYVWLSFTAAGGIIAQNDVSFEDVKIEAKRAPVVVEGYYGTYVTAPSTVISCPNPITQTGKVNCHNIRLSNMQLVQNSQYERFYQPDTFTLGQALEFRGNGLSIQNSEILGYGSQPENGTCVQTFESTGRGVDNCAGNKSYALEGNNIDIQDSYIESGWSEMRSISRTSIVHNIMKGLNGSCTGTLGASSRMYFARNSLSNCVDQLGGGGEAFTFDTPYAVPWIGKAVPGSIGGKTLTVAQMFSTVNNKAFNQDSIEWGQVCASPNANPCLPENLWNDAFMVIVSGTGLGQAIPIATNTYAPFSYSSSQGIPTSDITLAHPWTIRPDDTSVMAIVPRKDKITFYQNTVTNAKNSIQLYTDVYRAILDGNTFSRTLGTIAHTFDEYDPESDLNATTSLPERRFSFEYLNTYMNNTYNLDYYPAVHNELFTMPNQPFGANYPGLSGAARAMSATGNGTTYLTSEPLGLGHMANIYRNNAFKGSESASASTLERVGIGILVNEPRGGGITTCRDVSTAQIQARDTVVENNTVAGALPRIMSGPNERRGLIEIDTGSFAAIVRKNTCTSANPLYCADGPLRDIGQGTASFGAQKTTTPTPVIVSPSAYVCAPTGGRDLWL